MCDLAWPWVIIVIRIFFFLIPEVRDNFPIDSVVDGDEIDDDGKADPVAQNVEAEKTSLILQ